MKWFCWGAMSFYAGLAGGCASAGHLIYAFGAASVSILFAMNWMREVEK